MDALVIKNMVKSFLALVFCVSLATLEFGCPGPVVNVKANGPSPVQPPDTPWCATGCQYLQMLPGRDGSIGCEESRVLELPGGEILTCEQWCTKEQMAGRNLYPSCWPKAKKCTDIEEFRKRTMPCEGH